MPNFRTESEYVPGDRSWYDSIHGLANSRTEKLDVSTFTEADYPNGYLPSGTPVALGAGVVVKYIAPDEVGAGGNTFAGFLATDQRIFPDVVVINSPIFDHGRVRVNRLPVAFETPVDDASTIIFA